MHKNMTDAQLYQQIKTKRLIGQIADSCEVSRNLIKDVLFDGANSAYTELIREVATLANAAHDAEIQARLMQARERFNVAA